MNEEAISVLDLFSGIGGFSLGLERASPIFKTKAFCEVDKKCQSVLSHHWPNTEIHNDICDLSGKDFKDVNLVCGGFPCQPFSTASRGRQNARDFWPEMERLVTEIRPDYAIAENVQFLPVSRAADRFCEMGMQCDVVELSGYAIGADHRRNRWWAIAHPYKNGEFQRALNAEAQKLPTIRSSLWGSENYRESVRISNGFPRRMDYARLYGNAVIPLAVELIGRAIVRARDE